MSNDAVLDDAIRTLVELNSSVINLRKHVENVVDNLDRYAFTVLVSSAEGVISPSEFEEIGGITTVRKAVRILYDRVMADTTLVDYFTHVDMIRVRQRQVDMFLALMGAKDYEGINLSIAHHHHGITKEDFEKLMHHLAESLSEVGMGFEHSEALLDRFRAFESDIVLGKREVTG